MPLVHSAIQTEDLEALLPESESRHTGIYHTKLGTSLHSLQILKSRKETSIMSGKIKKIGFLFLCLLCFGWIILSFNGNLCIFSKTSCSFFLFKSKSTVEPLKNQYYNTPIDNIGKSLSHSMINERLPGFQDIVSKDFQFDIEDHDVMVFLHIQKTGGTAFGRHLVKDLELQRDCICHRKVKKRCTCLRPGTNSEETWLFSRFSTGWKCGLHADWTELTGCVDTVMNLIDDTENYIKRRYFYLTFLRNPISRYLSEYKHVKRGATWKTARLFCHGHSATKDEVPFCFEDEDWSGVDLKEFISCESNLANNRQTRMLADLTLVDCYNLASMNPEHRDIIMLASAKRNLAQMSFFGILEYQEISQYIFEETFNLKFSVRFEQHNETHAMHVQEDISSKLLQKIKKLNNLDIELYEYAKKLLLERFDHLKAIDNHFDEHFSNMGHKHFSLDNLD